MQWQCPACWIWNGYRALYRVDVRHIEHVRETGLFQELNRIDHDVEVGLLKWV